MKTSYIAMCFAAAVFLLTGCDQKPESDTDEKAKSPAAVEPAPSTGKPAQPGGAGTGGAVSEPEAPAIETVPSTEGVEAEGTGEADSDEGNGESNDPNAKTPAPAE